jgi:hypothetical protein
MGVLDKIYEAQFDLTPKPGKGFNVVGVDEYNDPGEELYLAGNFPTREAAEKHLAKMKRETPEERYYIYPPQKWGRYDPDKK